MAAQCRGVSPASSWALTSMPIRTSISTALAHLALPSTAAAAAMCNADSPKPPSRLARLMCAPLHRSFAMMSQASRKRSKSWLSLMHAAFRSTGPSILAGTLAVIFCSNSVMQFFPNSISFDNKMSFSSVTVHLAASAFTRIDDRFQAIAESNWPKTHRFVDSGARIATIPSPQATSHRRPCLSAKNSSYKHHRLATLCRQVRLVGWSRMSRTPLPVFDKRRWVFSADSLADFSSSPCLLHKAST
mmetsp:Transcript_31412/g.73656  ORF Transcript_31412/g.73656 Transcript_31412/m.73656 type:complete len:245 (-) Transcript_31412:1681-2415(-)